MGRINLPVWFDRPEFADEGPVSDPWSGVEKPRRFVIRAADGRHEVIAEGVEVVVGTVYYYDRGTQLRPGERIATWVKREDAEPGAAPDPARDSGSGSS